MKHGIGSAQGNVQAVPFLDELRTTSDCLIKYKNIPLATWKRVNLSKNRRHIAWTSRTYLYKTIQSYVDVHADMSPVFARIIPVGIPYGQTIWQCRMHHKMPHLPWTAEFAGNDGFDVLVSPVGCSGE